MQDEKKCSDLTFKRSLLHPTPTLTLLHADSWRDAGKSEIRAETFHRPAGFPCLKPWYVYVSCLVAGLGHSTGQHQRQRQHLEIRLW